MTIDNHKNRELKYLQLAESITSKIKMGELGINDQLPSVNQLSKDWEMSKSTILAGLNHLSEKGIIESVYRKGYYVRKNQIDHRFRVFFLLDRLTVFKEQLYNSFYNELKDNSDIDVYFHNHNKRLFERLVLENLHNYTHYLILSTMKEDVSDIINKIPPHKRIILELNQQNLSGDYSAIYQDFAGDLYSSLKDLKEKISKYRRLVLVLPEDIFHGHLIKEGFFKFCKDFDQENVIINQISEKDFHAGDAYITLDRFNLDDVNIIKLVKKNKLKLGKDIGLVSYNDLPVKEVLEGGITVITTDFSKMGEEAARLIIEDRIAKIKNPSRLIIRSSL